MKRESPIMTVQSSPLEALGSGRRHDIDCLRVLAFGLLIFYHIGMYYVADWGWHVKSPHQSEFLQNIMIFPNQWRMSLLFFISGVALCLVEPKMGSWRLFKSRFFRIFIPLLIGMYLIVPPQLYFELQQKLGFAGDYFEFMRMYINPHTQRYPEAHVSPAGMLTWNHLWYLPYLFMYSLVYILIKPVLKLSGAWLQARTVPLSLVFLVPFAIFLVNALILKPIYPKTHALFNDWYHHALSFSVFVWGYLSAKSMPLWQRIVHARKVWLLMGIIGYLGVLSLHHQLWAPFYQYEYFNVFNQALIYANLWAWILTVTSYATVYLNRPFKWIPYLNEIILPAYILHQTLIILLVMGMAPFDLGPVLEPILTVILCFVVSWGGVELIRRVKALRFIFGMKLQASKSKLTTSRQVLSRAS